MLTDISEMTSLMQTQGMFYLAVLFWSFMGGLFLLYLVGGIAGIVHLLRIAKFTQKSTQAPDRTMAKPSLRSHDHREAA